MNFEISLNLSINFHSLHDIYLKYSIVSDEFIEGEYDGEDMNNIYDYFLLDNLMSFAGHLRIGKNIYDDLTKPLYV